MPKSLRSASGGSFNVGVDTGRSVDGRDYQVPFRFTGKIYKLTVRLRPDDPRGTRDDLRNAPGQAIGDVGFPPEQSNLSSVEKTRQDPDLY